jgi:hypothetical protein
MPSYQRTAKVPGKSAQEIYDRVAADIERFLSKVPLGHVDINRDAAKRTVSVKSSMFSGELVCKDGELALDAKLSLMALPFKSKLDEGIDKWLAKTFSA